MNNNNPLLDPDVVEDRLHKLRESWASLAIENMHGPVEEKDWFVSMVKQGLTDEQIGQAIDEKLKAYHNENRI